MPVAFNGFIITTYAFNIQEFIITLYAFNIQ